MRFRCADNLWKTITSSEDDDSSSSDEEDEKKNKKLNRSEIMLFSQNVLGLV